MTAVKEQFMQMLPQMQRDIPRMSDDDVQKLVNLWIKIQPAISEKQYKKPIRRQFGALKNDDFYMAPDFDSCFSDNPAACGMEGYM